MPSQARSGPRRSKKVSRANGRPSLSGACSGLTDLRRKPGICLASVVQPPVTGCCSASSPDNLRPAGQYRRTRYDLTRHYCLNNTVWPFAAAMNASGVASSASCSTATAMRRQLPGSLMVTSPMSCCRRSGVSGRPGGPPNMHEPRANKRAHRFEFDRDSNCSPKRLARLYNHFTDIMTSRCYLVTTGESSKSLELKYIELLLRPGNQDAQWQEQNLLAR